MGRFSLPDQKPDGLDAPLTKKIIKAGSKAQVAVFKLTNGRIGSTWRVGAGFKKPVPTLLLENTGRKSGTTFTTPLVYMERGPDIVVVASQGGLPKNPAWYYNLKANPDTVIHLRGERGRKVHAREATGDEYDQLWSQLLGVYADFAKYKEWTDRHIPVMVLESRS